MRVLLFDIDGTLMRGGGAGKYALESALAETFALELRPVSIPFSGRTDRSISHDLLLAHGVEPSDDHISQLIDAYLARLPQSLKLRPPELCPGVPVLIERLIASEHRLGLLTGNVRRGAEVKLNHVGIWEHFTFGGGFGDRHHDRDDVARDALAHVHAAHGEPSEVWVIGDTPLDVRCARAIGAKVIAVATGGASRSELAATKPDHLCDDLTDAATLMSLWNSP